MQTLVVLATVAACATIIPPIERSIPQQGHGETAIYATVDGETERLVSDYPERAARMGLQGDVLLRCTAPDRCVLIPEAEGNPQNSPLFTPSALALAEQALTPTHRFPADIVISYRIISDPADTDSLWAPAACPDRRFPQYVNRQLRRQREINGVCITTQPAVPRRGRN